MGGGEDRGEVATRLEALEVALDDISSHELPATLVICRTPSSGMCGSRTLGRDGCEFCYRHDVRTGDTPESIEALVRQTA
jgi:hypothetical protein